MTKECTSSTLEPLSDHIWFSFTKRYEHGKWVGMIVAVNKMNTYKCRTYSNTKICLLQEQHTINKNMKNKWKIKNLAFFWSLSMPVFLTKLWSDALNSDLKKKGIEVSSSIIQRWLLEAGWKARWCMKKATTGKSNERKML